jgi:hypothetical protein
MPGMEIISHTNDGQNLEVYLTRTPGLTDLLDGGKSRCVMLGVDLAINAV